LSGKRRRREPKNKGVHNCNWARESGKELENPLKVKIEKKRSEKGRLEKGESEGG